MNSPIGSAHYSDHADHSGPHDLGRLDRPSIEARRALLTAYAVDLQAILVLVSKEEFDDPDVHRTSMENTRRGISELIAAVDPATDAAGCL